MSTCSSSLLLVWNAVAYNQKIVRRRLLSQSRTGDYIAAFSFLVLHYIIRTDGLGPLSTSSRLLASMSSAI